ncbi:hypothetical protein ACQPU1_06440 [Clostridium paraputrificum]|uniref:hypothetical protein n=1 Tax=Clostridium paraputrificum TaxID=29363 RepID=UPI003D33446A
MDVTTKVYYLDSSTNTLTFTYTELNQCPICKHSIKPYQMHGVAYKVSDTHYNVTLLFLCPFCKDSFIIQFDKLMPYQLSLRANSTNPKISPVKFTEQTFDDLINNTSPTFVKIYNQALSAETQGLDEIAGIGYRKALEFLIKDFTISRNPDKEDKIKKSLLGKCINDYMDNPQLRTAASRAVWLGNDQTHYIQKFEDKDIDDLKLLIRLTVHWILMILETEVAATIEPR